MVEDGIFPQIKSRKHTRYHFCVLSAVWSGVPTKSPTRLLSPATGMTVTDNGEDI